MGFLVNHIILTLLLIMSGTVIADDIDSVARKGSMLKFLREMVNQTEADTLDSLNLPANATTIRENIVDTFSCENRTYGYYADVDNECQLFHVCLPTQNPSRRNVTYRWSFICPNETVFNQEALTCARPRDSIDCEDSPMYFDLNMEIGKVEEPEQHEQLSQNEQHPQNIYEHEQMPQQIVGVIHERRKPSRKNNKLKSTVENFRESHENFKHYEFAPILEDIVITDNQENENYEVEIETNIPKVSKVKEKSNKKNINNTHKEIEDSDLKRKSRKIRRGSFRFKADV